MKPRSKILIAVIALLVVYVGSYIVLSVFGQYEPTVWGLFEVKGKTVYAPKYAFYEWAPYGFVNEDLHWNHKICFPFLPLWAIDQRIWHDTDSRWKGKYPEHHIESK